MAKLRAKAAQRHWKVTRHLTWVLPMVGACSIYDPSLLGSEAIAGADGTGLSTSGGKSTTSGGVGNGEGGSTTSPGGTGSEGGEPNETGGTTTGGSLSTGGTGSSPQGGTISTGGVAATGSAPATGGATATGGVTAGGVTSTGGASKGGTTSTGGVPATGGASKGGTTSTGGVPATGGASKGGTTSTGGVPATGGVTATGGAGGTDSCPSDPDKTAPGVCGCGVPEQNSGTTAGCVPLKNALLHRYSFSGTGTRVTDSIGTAHGTVMNATLGNTGSLTLAGTTTDQFVDLPNGILSSLSNATIEVWLTWSGGNGWQRIFDFGSNSGAEGSQGTGLTYLFLTPKGSSPSNLKVTFSTNGSGNETFVSGTAALATNVVSHVSVVVDNANELLSLYLNGAAVGSAAFTGDLSGISDVNNWLGRSQYAPDVEFAGALHELRIYNVALSAAQIQLTQQTGSDPAFF